MLKEHHHCIRPYSFILFDEEVHTLESEMLNENDCIWPCLLIHFG